MNREESSRNADDKVVKGFGSEWAHFPQDELDPADHEAIFAEYFAIFPWEKLPANPVGTDIGCGSGRWAKLVAPRVGTLHCVDASVDALNVARRNLALNTNVQFHVRSVDELPFASNSLDFAYSLGVLHHVPDTAAAIRSVAQCVKPGAPVLLYLYYGFDNRPAWFRGLWQLSELGRATIAKLPDRPKQLVCEIIAGLVYYPLARAAKVLDRLGMLPAAWPLSAYRDRTFYVMRTDSLDRFGTRLEQRFTRVQITRMMTDAGLRDIVFSNASPFWCAVGTKGAA